MEADVADLTEICEDMSKELGLLAKQHSQLLEAAGRLQAYEQQNIMQLNQSNLCSQADLLRGHSLADAVYSTRPLRYCQLSPQSSARGLTETATVRRVGSAPWCPTPRCSMGRSGYQPE